MINKEKKRVDFSAMERKNRVLEEARTVLKGEFIGLDSIIDGIAESLLPWFLAPELQRRPLVVNLWGMTGVGKTSLALRLAELLGFQDRAYRYSMDDPHVDTEIMYQLKELALYEPEKPFIIILDEFQKSRTVDERGDELQRRSSAILWDFLDNGNIPTGRGMNRWEWNADSIYELWKKAAACLQEGVKVGKGRVVQGQEIHARIMEENGGDGASAGGTPRFIPADDLKLIGVGAYGEYLSERELARSLGEMNGPETLTFLEGLFRKSLAGQKVQVPQVLVFVIGNLDEAFTMSGNFHPDIGADQFRELSREISLPMVKEALRRRFRSEQIGRLGNIHFIYPALGEKEFRQVIKRNFRLLEEDFRSFTGKEIFFGPSLEDLVYREGVYPVLGVRPVLSTINRILGSRLGEICVRIGLQSVESDRVVLSHRDGRIRIEYFREGDAVFRSATVHSPELESLRVSRRDDQQALVAVHEAGHAVLSYLLLGIIPSNIRSVSAGPGSLGFTQVKDERNFRRRGEIVQRVAVYLGGLTAEELVFGKENLSSGGRGDVEAATALAAAALKDFGFGEIPGFYSASDGGSRYEIQDDGKINRAVENFVQRAHRLARETLRENCDALLGIADCLSDKSAISGEEFRRFFPVPPGDDHAGGFPYREKLKELVASWTSPDLFTPPAEDESPHAQSAAAENKDFPVLCPRTISIFSSDEI